MRTNNGWLRAGMSLWGLTLDSMAVISLRTAKIAMGGKEAEAEAQKMVSEKIEAGLALQTMAMTGGLGMTPESALTKTLAHYRPKVRANRRRLAKSS